MRSAPDDELGLLAVDLGDAATQTDRELVSDRLRAFGGGGAEWDEAGRRAVFTLAPERLPAGESAADNVLAAALAVRELLLVPVAIACDVLPRSASDAERWLVPRRLTARVEAHPDALVVTRSVAESRAARGVPIERIAGAVDALFAVRSGARACVAPLGRWVVPLGQDDWEQRSAASALFGQPWIQEGLLRSERVDDKLDASELLRAEDPLVVVVAPAWTGKTFLTDALARALARIGTPCHVTSLEHREGGHTHWPDQAFLRASGERVWLVDALDEGCARAAGLGELGAAGAHTGLRTIVLTRSDALAEAALRDLNVPRSTYVLLPLDREAVLRDVCEGDVARLDALLAVAHRMGVVHPLSFAEWQELERQVRRGGEPERRELLAALLDRRCHAWRRGRGGALPAGMPRAARWLATLAAATGAPRFTFGDGGDLDVLCVVPVDLRAAAQALRDTVVLARTGGRHGDEWAFAAAHLAEDLAASFLAETKTLERLGAQRLRRLLTDGVQPWPDLSRVIARTDELTGGELSRRLAPMPGEARRSLDAIFDVARSAGDEILWGLGGAELSYLGQALTSDYARERLAEPHASRCSRHLALRLARAAGWTDLAPEAVAMARDAGEDVELREIAASLALSASALPALEPLVHEIDRDGADPDLTSLRATLLRRMLEQGHITPAAAIPLASEPTNTTRMRVSSFSSRSATRWTSRQRAS